MTHNIQLEKFEGPRWKNNVQTISKNIIIENKWMSLSRHIVKTHPKLDGTINKELSKIINDWFWIDTMNQINILVTTIIDEIEYFVIFEQTKYGYNGISYAVVGGHIDNTDNNPLSAAKRELFEELGMIVENDNNWIEFNKNEGFRTDVNRGLGFCHTFLARKAIFKNNEKKKNQFFDETEELHVKYVTLNQLIQYFQNGLFKEAKWSNTVGLGLMYMLLNYQNDNIKQSNLPN